MSSLFRREALEARQISWLGNVQISQPLPVRIVSGFCIVLVIASALLVIFCNYTRRVHATGQVMPESGLLTISATQPGTITAIKAKEGQHVHRGDILFIEDLDIISSNGSTQKQVLNDLLRQKELLQNQRELREKSAPLEKQALLNQVQFLNQQHTEINAQIISDNKVLPLVEQALNKMYMAQSSHLITEEQFQSQLSTYAQLLSTHSQTLQSQTTTEGKLSDIVSKITRFNSDLTHDLNDLDKQIASVDQQIAENEGRQSNIILAPEDGTLTSLRGYLGQQVSANTPLITLLPNNDKLQVELYVNSSSIGFLKVNQPVLLRYDAFPYQKFGLQHGHIIEITHAPVTSDTVANRAAASAPQGKQGIPSTSGQDIYRIRVLPDRSYIQTYSEKHPLEAGMTVSADIATDRRPLWQWILDPVISIKNTISTTTIGP
ncbi:HlyD family secretion protein [Swingsia samuiensis]|uniref:HlyD family efflux transporter periplasmic adaptor subunit n=1 Tax=Swingsia samuiensis TaxID=1293412 RepID=A0A4Y6UI50_9PROT|nr:HlyD family efflux transporter periplasmic adaptor subunit [Swingsia samuiensis]QDH16724.1 HlyD family efflux transporter periplasmic adaptor subunit [Swingsia samuiensis]